MAIQPIDLQTLFSRLHQISEDQAAQRDQAAQAQLVAGQETVRKGTEQARTVTLPEELQEGPASVDEEEAEGEGATEKHKRRRRRKPGDSVGPPASVEVFSDPDLGRNVDISG